MKKLTRIAAIGSALIGFSAAHAADSTGSSVFESRAGAKLRFAEDGSTVAVTQFGKLLVASNTVHFAKY